MKTEAAKLYWVQSCAFHEAYSTPDTIIEADGWFLHIKCGYSYSIYWLASSVRFTNSCVLGGKKDPNHSSTESVGMRSACGAQQNAWNWKAEVPHPPPSNCSGSGWSEANTSTKLMFCSIFLTKCVIFNYLNTTLNSCTYSIKHWVTSTHIASKFLKKKKTKTFFESPEEKNITPVPCYLPSFIDCTFLDSEIQRLQDKEVKFLLPRCNHFLMTSFLSIPYGNSLLGSEQASVETSSPSPQPSSVRPPHAWPSSAPLS